MDRQRRCAPKVKPPAHAIHVDVKPAFRKVIGVDEYSVDIALLLYRVQHLVDSFVDPAERLNLYSNDILSGYRG
jgi:hypothetical protein